MTGICRRSQSFEIFNSEPWQFKTSDNVKENSFFILLTPIIIKKNKMQFSINVAEFYE